jgi:hypothetical protein
MAGPRTDSRRQTLIMTDMQRVQGVFHDEKRVRKAVERLQERSVPVDEITVTVLDASGAPKRDMPVEGEGGVLHGALLGAAVGGGLGFAAAILAIGVYAGWSQLVTAIGLSWMIRGALIGAMGGFPLGAILGMGRWRRDEELGAEDLDAGSVMVEVRTDELVDLARQVLDEAGAEQVTVTRS